jgi:DNA-directed RNA polymerase specialized sigma24 family protein
VALLGDEHCDGAPPSANPEDPRIPGDTVSGCEPSGHPGLPVDRFVASTEDDEVAVVADRVGRVVEDARMLAQLRQVGFEGLQAELLRDELIRYGWAVLNALILNGTVFAHAARLKRGVHCPDELREQLRRSPDDREDIASEIVARVLPRFWQNALVEGQWRADCGTQITTYFTNALLLEFSNVFAAWKRQQRTSRVHQGDRAYEIPGEVDAEERRLVLEEMGTLKPREREIVALHYDGYTHAEINELTGGASERAVEGVLYRWRAKQAGYRDQQGGQQ